MKEYLSIKNGYSNQKDRHSFSLEILKCNGQKCQADPSISKLLDEIYFNIYILDEEVELGNFDKPLAVVDSFHSQFKLDLDSYRDNNNFLVYNDFIAKDQRFKLWYPPNIFKFFQVDQKPVWQSSKMIQTQNISESGSPFEIKQ